ncbi:hypothetical protein LCGC14_1938570 [marine sediment metagenome]|uniref:Uncharacterized protein n=1 Tax=marine sediment metagenome TaxID=412755 RepID=A0A0F9HZG6_9ZZZZ
MADEFPVVCAWCQPSPQGTSSTICPACLAKELREIAKQPFRAIVADINRMTREMRKRGL